MLPKNDPPPSEVFAELFPSDSDSVSGPLLPPEYSSPSLA
jgi:hypothetical protein